ncbi:hypothetical protein NP493_182g04011 [Ridgeia piscesae]|uniref:MYCBP-associated protein n=1 Tax=Ridgeia piscesae TaxID=27915 RepID=A0AAD9UF18_RIDPI|nr:hypothetical protein NP493_182g04011 [Ridgeia piscesae]
MSEGTTPLARLPKLRNKLWANVRAKTLTANKLRKASKRDTPEKPGTPNASQENLLDDGTAVEKKHIIINDEILALRIKTEDLKKLREPRPPSEERLSKKDEKSVVVRKLRPYSEWHKPPTKTLVVARPAPPDARLRPTDCIEIGGLRFDDNGDAIPHSILGSVDEYKKEAERRGELPLELYGEEAGGASTDQLQVKYDKPHPRTHHPRMESTDMTNALKNWTQKMRDRKRQQGYLSKLLNKPPCQLAMNQGHRVREVEETRYLIDRTLHTIDYGKGYRTGSEFWTQQEPLGDELSGIHVTVTQTLRGYPPPMEHIGQPKVTKQEAGVYCRDSPDTISKPWHYSTFLHQRLNQLGGVIKELDPHWPSINKLQIRGRAADAAPSSEEEELSRMTDNEASSQLPAQESHASDDPLRNYPDVHPEPVIGPSLLFSGQVARWAGNVCSDESPSQHIEARIPFEVSATKRVTSFLEIVNDGTTAIYFEWVKVQKNNPFEIMTSRIQRFYFNTTSGVILPGDVLKFPFVFKSPNAGVFSEQWHFQTQPMLNAGSPLLVTLRGVALQEDKYANQRSSLEQMLSHRQAEQIAMTILSDLLEGIRTPERPRSPIDTYITEEEIFLRKNPHLHYDHRLVTRLKELYIDTMTVVSLDVECSMDDWDLDVNGLKQVRPSQQLRSSSTSLTLTFISSYH